MIQENPRVLIANVARHKIKQGNPAVPIVLLVRTWVIQNRQRVCAQFVQWDFTKMKMGRKNVKHVLLANGATERVSLSNPSALNVRQENIPKPKVQMA